MVTAIFLEIQMFLKELHMGKNYKKEKMMYDV